MVHLMCPGYFYSTMLLKSFSLIQLHWIVLNCIDVFSVTIHNSMFVIFVGLAQINMFKPLKMENVL